MYLGQFEGLQTLIKGLHRNQRGDRGLIAEQASHVLAA